MTIYLDNLAATPIDARVAQCHGEAMSAFPGNPHSLEHKVGVDAQRAIDGAAAKLLASLGTSDRDVLVTPGASAALWLAVEDAIGRVRGRLAHIAASRAEHPSLLYALDRAEAAGRVIVTRIPVDPTGVPCPDAVRQALDSGVDLLCTMAANNELGTITELAGIARLAAERGARLLVDASQAAGKIVLSAALSADLLVVSGAKIYGPRRAGALIGGLTEYSQTLAHSLFGSPDPSSAVALAFAMELRAIERATDEPRIAMLRDRLQAYLENAVPGLQVNGALQSRLAGSLHVSTPHLPGEAVVARLYSRIAISTGAACQSGVPGPSHVLKAIDMPDWARDGAVRIGLGRFNTDEEIDQAGPLIAAALRAAAPQRRCA